MYRAMIRVSVVAFALSAVQAVEAADVVVGKKFEGELTQPEKRVDNIDDFRNTIPCFATELKVALKAGQGISLTAEAKGAARKIGILLEDPAGSRVIFTNLKDKRLDFDVEELNATGKYTITVMSDRIGPFTLKVTDAANDDDNVEDVQTLEDNVNRLKKQLEEAEARLKAAKSKK